MVNAALQVILSKVRLNPEFSQAQRNNIMTALSKQLESMYENFTLKLILDSYTLLFKDNTSAIIEIRKEQEKTYGTRGYFMKAAFGDFDVISKVIKLYLNAIEDSSVSLHSILIHEMTHAVMEEAFYNGCLPLQVGATKDLSEYTDSAFKTIGLHLKVLAITHNPKLLDEFINPKSLYDFEQIYRRVVNNLDNDFRAATGYPYEILSSKIADLRNLNSIERWDAINSLELKGHNSKERVLQKFFKNNLNVDSYKTIDQFLKVIAYTDKNIITHEYIAFYITSLSIDNSYHQYSAPMNNFVRNFLAPKLAKLYQLEENDLELEYKRIDEDYTHEFNAMNVFLDAAISSDFAAIEKLVAEGFDLNKKIVQLTPLQIAMRLNNVSLFKFLLDGMDIYLQQDIILLESLFISHNTSEFLETLLAKGMKDVNNLVLKTAIYSGLAEYANVLIEHNKQELSMNKELVHGLWRKALDDENYNTVQYFLDNGFEIDIYHGSPLSINQLIRLNLKDKYITDKVNYFKRYKFSEYEVRSFIYDVKGAIVNADVDFVKEIFKALGLIKAPIDQLSNIMISCIPTALEQGDIDTTKYFLDNLDLYAPNLMFYHNDGFRKVDQEVLNSLFISALKGGDKEVVLEILKLKIVDLSNIKLLFEIVKYGHLKTIAEAYNNVDDLNNLLTNFNGQLDNECQIARLTYANQAMVISQNHNGLVPSIFVKDFDYGVLNKAVITGNIDSVKLLLLAGFDPLVATANKFYPYVTLKIDNLDFDTIANINFGEKLNAMQLAVILNRKNILKLFLNQGYDINYVMEDDSLTDAKGLLHLAVITRNIDMVSFLLDEGANPNLILSLQHVTYTRGPLELGIESKYGEYFGSSNSDNVGIKIIESLLASGANPYISVNKFFKMSFVDYAIDKGRLDAIQLVSKISQAKFPDLHFQTSENYFCNLNFIDSTQERSKILKDFVDMGFSFVNSACLSDQLKKLMIHFEPKTIDFILSISPEIKSNNQIIDILKNGFYYQGGLGHVLYRRNDNDCKKWVYPTLYKHGVVSEDELIKLFGAIPPAVRIMEKFELEHSIDDDNCLANVSENVCTTLWQ